MLIAAPSQKKNLTHWLSFFFFLNKDYLQGHHIEYWNQTGANTAGSEAISWPLYIVYIVYTLYMQFYAKIHMKVPSPTLEEQNTEKKNQVKFTNLEPAFH